MGQAFLSREIPTRVTVTIECTLWNLGSLAVMVGTIIEAPLLVSVGGLTLLVAVALLANTVRATNSRPPRLRRSYLGIVRSEGRCVGKVCVSTCSSRGSPYY